VCVCVRACVCARERDIHECKKNDQSHCWVLVVAVGLQGNARHGPAMRASECMTTQWALPRTTSLHAVPACGAALTLRARQCIAFTKPRDSTRTLTVLLGAGGVQKGSQVLSLTRPALSDLLSGEPSERGNG
jgi:hypothetical protein